MAFNGAGEHVSAVLLDNAERLDKLVNGPEAIVATAVETHCIHGDLFRNLLSQYQLLQIPRSLSCKSMLISRLIILRTAQRLSQSVVSASAQAAIQDINSTVTQTANDAAIVLAGLGYLPPAPFSSGLSVSSTLLLSHITGIPMRQ
jgi:hypothetical protein